MSLLASASPVRALVNDLFGFLNTRLGLRIPLLPLDGFPAFTRTLWQRVVSNWTSGEDPPPVVEVDITAADPLLIPVGPVSMAATSASIVITPAPSSPHTQETSA